MTIVSVASGKSETSFHSIRRKILFSFLDATTTMMMDPYERIQLVTLKTSASIKSSCNVIEISSRKAEENKKKGFSMSFFFFRLTRILSLSKLVINLIKETE
jgi:hypothetical protein